MHTVVQGDNTPTGSPPLMRCHLSLFEKPNAFRSARSIFCGRGHRPSQVAAAAGGIAAVRLDTSGATAAAGRNNWV